MFALLTIVRSWPDMADDAHQLVPDGLLKISTIIDNVLAYIYLN